MKQIILKLKNLFYLISTTTIILTNSCHKVEVNNTTDNNKCPKFSDFSFLGSIHNSGIERSLNFLKTKKELKKEFKTFSQIIEEQDTTIVMPILEESFNDNLLNIAIEQKDKMKDIILSSNKFNGNNFLDSVINNTEMSNQIKYYLIKIENCNKNYLLNSKEKISYYYKLADTIQTDVENNNYKSVLYSILNVAIAITDYWNKHLNHWIDLFEIQYKSDVSTVIGVDIGGAICGGLGGLAIGGVGAGPGAVGGGLLASLGASIAILWNYYI